MSGPRVKGREAIACGAAGALDTRAATGTLIGRGKVGLRLALVLPLSLIIIR